MMLFRRSLNTFKSEAACSDQDWSRSSESTPSMVFSWRSLDCSEFGHLQICLHELLRLWSFGSFVISNDCFNDVDIITSSTVSTGHLTVHLRHCSTKTAISVFFVHVDNTCASKIFKDNTVVFDGIGFSLEDFADGNDFSLTLSNLLLSLHFIPELRSCNDNVLGKDSYSIAGWIWVRLRWCLSSNNPVLTKLKTIRILVKMY